MRTKHDSDAAFEAWVTAGEGEKILRTHTVQAAFREGWNAGHKSARQQDLGAMEQAHEVNRGVRPLGCIHQPSCKGTQDCLDTTARLKRAR